MLRVLKHQSHVAAQRLFIISLLIDILSIIIDLSTAGPKQTVQMLDQRGFTGSGMTDQSDKLSILNLKAYIFKRILLKGCPFSIQIVNMFCPD